mgnify:CR=1 FL=1
MLIKYNDFNSKYKAKIEYLHLKITRILIDMILLIKMYLRSKYVFFRSIFSSNEKNYNFVTFLT